MTTNLMNLRQQVDGSSIDFTEWFRKTPWVGMPLSVDRLPPSTTIYSSAVVMQGVLPFSTIVLDVCAIFG